MNRTFAFARSFHHDERGVAAVEMALIGTLIMGALFNVVEVGRYVYQSMELAAASQAGAQAAIVTCDTNKTPVTSNCPAAPAAIQMAIRGTSLGDSVVQHGPLDEAWYCVNFQGTLQAMSAATVRPADCSDAGVVANKPALYLRVTVAYDYQAIFPGVTVVDALPHALERSAWMRML